MDILQLALSAQFKTNRTHQPTGQSKVVLVTKDRMITVATKVYEQYSADKCKEFMDDVNKMALEARRTRLANLDARNSTTSIDPTTPVEPTHLTDPVGPNNLAGPIHLAEPTHLAEPVGPNQPTGASTSTTMCAQLVLDSADSTSLQAVEAALKNLVAKINKLQASTTNQHKLASKLTKLNTELARLRLLHCKLTKLVCN